jgi:hypothetical protein
VWRHLLSLAETDVNMVNQYGLTALHTACRYGHCLKEQRLEVHHKREHGLLCEEPGTVPVKKHSSMLMNQISPEFSMISFGSRHFHIFFFLEMSANQLVPFVQAQMNHCLKIHTERTSIQVPTRFSGHELQGWARSMSLQGKAGPSLGMSY